VCGTIYTPKAAHSGYPLKIRRAALRLFAKGASMRFIGKTLGISPQTVSTWVHRYAADRIWMEHARAKEAKYRRDPGRQFYVIEGIMNKVATQIVESAGGHIVYQFPYRDGWVLGTPILNRSYYESMFTYYLKNGTRMPSFSVRLATTATKDDIEQFATTVRHAVHQQARELKR
jgi:Homeodomain-like domain